MVKKIFLIFVIMIVMVVNVVVYAEGDDFSGGYLDGVIFRKNVEGYGNFTGMYVTEITDNDINTGSSFTGGNYMWCSLPEPSVVKSIKIRKRGNISLWFYKKDEGGNDVFYKVINLYVSDGYDDDVVVEKNIYDVLGDELIVGMAFYTSNYNDAIWEVNVYGHLLGDVDEVPPGDVMNLSSVVDGRNVILTWVNPNDNFSHVMIYRNGILIRNGYTLDSYVDSDLDYGVYEYKIVAVDVNGNVSSGVIISVEVKQDTLPVSDIVGLEYQVGVDSVSFSWTNPVENFQRVDIYRDGVKVYETTLNYFVDEGLRSGKLYNYRFVVVGLNGEESFGVQILVKTLEEVDDVPPSVPRNLQVVAMVGKLYVRWDDVSDDDLSGYNVYVNGVKYNTELIKRNWILIENLNIGEEYRIKVTAVDFSGNESMESDEVIGVPVESGMPSLSVGFDLGNVVQSVSNWFSSLWPILAFTVGITLAFVVGRSIKELFVEDN